MDYHQIALRVLQDGTLGTGLGKKPAVYSGPWVLYQQDDTMRLLNHYTHQCVIFNKLSQFGGALYLALTGQQFV